MPAIISTHVHPGFQKGLTYSAENFTRENILDDLNRALYFGISTVMSQGIEKGDVMYRIRADQAAGKLGGARLMLAGRGIGAPNAGPGAAAYAHIAYEITTEDEARSAARELAANKVDAIKIWVDDRGGRAPKLPIALSRVVIDEGHKAGLKVAAHVFYHDDAVELADAGINTLRPPRARQGDERRPDRVDARPRRLFDAQYRRAGARHPHRAAAVVRGALSRRHAARHRAGRGDRPHPRFALRAAMPRPPRATRRTTKSCSAASPSSMPPACASSSAATPGSRITCSAMPSRRSSS